MALIVFVVMGGMLLFLNRPQPLPIEIVESSPETTPTPQDVGVYVVGAVVNPGVYFLPPESRVVDALEAAGGPTEEADLARVNLAQRVHDEEEIYVPQVGEENPPLPPPTGSSTDLRGGKIDINRADATTLEFLPGIGPVLAQRIIDYREANGSFATVEDIKNVRGIGEATFVDIEELISVQ